MTNPAHRDPYAGLMKSQPVFVTAFALWLTGNIGVLVVGRAHLLTAAQWSGESAGLTAIISAAVGSVVAWLLHRIVGSPATLARMRDELAAARSAIEQARAAANQQPPPPGGSSSPVGAEPISALPLAGQPPSPVAAVLAPAAVPPQTGLPPLTADSLPDAAPVSEPAQTEPTAA